MLSQSTVDEHEEQLRVRINKLTEDNRKQFYFRVKNQIKDPDTYAALNWFLIAGLHHFYLGKWVYGIFDLSLFAFGLLLIIYGYPYAGSAVIVFVLAIELWALFRSQIIVQDWNNMIYERVLGEFESKIETTGVGPS